MAAQKALLANASHELRSPLARIRMAVELLESDDRADASKEPRKSIVELDQLVRNPACEPLGGRGRGRPSKASTLLRLSPKNVPASMLSSTVTLQKSWVIPGCFGGWCVISAMAGACPSRSR
jgi:signal transduction histidine kinase